MNGIPEHLSDDDMIPDSLALTKEQIAQAASARLLDEATRGVNSVRGLSATAKATGEAARTFGEVLGCCLQMHEVAELRRLYERS